MGTLRDTGNTKVKVGGTTFGALHVHRKPLEFGALGHYRVSHRCAIVNTQAATSRLFELRNPSTTNLIVPTRLRLSWLPTGAHTAAIEDSLDVYKCTGFTLLDTTNTVTPTAARARTGNMAAAPGSAQLRGVTIAGNSAGMTGGTLTKEGTALFQTPVWLLAALPTASLVTPTIVDLFFEDDDEHPVVLGQDEGIIIENRVLLGAAAASSVYIDLAYAEITAF